MKLGELIVNYRTEHELSLRAFARASGLSPTYISMLEKGVNRRGSTPAPSVDTYRSIAKAMGMDVDELIRAVDDKIEINSSPVMTEDEYDQELREVIEEMRNRPDMRMLFRLAKGAKAEDVRAAVKIIEALREEET